MKKIITIEIEGEDEDAIDSTVRHVCFQINQGYVTGFNFNDDTKYRFEVKCEV